MKKKRLVVSVVVGAALALAVRSARAQAASPSPAAKPAAGQSPVVGVASSTSTVAEPGVSDLYPIDRMRLRDPFVKAGGASGGGGGDIETIDVNIHNLVLKGILQDPAGDLALFVDPASGQDLVLKKGILLNKRNEPVPGISGLIKPKQKTVHLINAEKDVQTFVLGEQGGL